jgi:type IV pilus assembly protein PilW
MARRRTSAGQLGLSLVELMVGIAVGLFVVAGAAMVVSTQLGDNRRLLLETQVQQDLRATLDIVARELRRAGAMPNPVGMVSTATAAAQVNPLQGVTLSAGDSQAVFQFERAPGITGPFGFKLEDGVVKSLLGGVWQELTDGNVMRVTRFQFTPAFEPAQVIPCPRACAAGPADTSCWPTLVVRAYDIEIEAQSLADPAVRRRLATQVRLANDMVQSNLVPPSGSLCP